MGNYCQIFYQIIFSTKHRQPTIDETNCRELYQYISDVVKNKNCKLYRVNGLEDHIHIFSDLHPVISLSDYIKDIKVASNGWMKTSGKFPKLKHGKRDTEHSATAASCPGTDWQTQERDEHR